MKVFSDIKFYIKTHGLLSTIFNLGLWSLIFHRFGHCMHNRIVFKFLLLWYVYILFKNLLQLIAKIELPPSCKIGKNFNMVHAYGLVMGNKVQIGDNCTIGPWVVFGHNGVPEEQPIIGNNVYIGAHACILGKVKISDNALIGVNTVVTRDVPANATVKAIFEITEK